MKNSELHPDHPLSTRVHPEGEPWRDKWWVLGLLEKLVKERGESVGLTADHLKFFHATWNTDDDRCYEDWLENPAYDPDAEDEEDE